MRHRRIVAIIAAVLGLFAACGDGEDRPGQVTSESGGEGSGSVSGSSSSAGGEHGGEHSEEKDSEAAFASGEETTAVDVTLQDYAFVGIPATVQGPNVLFKASIEGGSTHELYVVDAADEKIGEIHGFKAGTTKELAVVLKPGTYTLQCEIKEGSKTHAELGMKQTLTVS